MTEFEDLYGKKTVKVTSGIEGWAQTNRNTYWHVKFDRTCGPKGKGVDYGWEIASYIGTGLPDINHIARAARFLGNRGAVTNRNCGLHVHVETTDFNNYLMGTLMARWIKLEPILIAICHPSRDENQYCRTLRSRRDMFGIKYHPLYPDKFWSAMKPTDISPHNNYDKRYTLNTIGYAAACITPSHSRNTAELRLPECMLEESHVRNWAKLIINFVDVTQKCLVAPDTLSSVKTVEEALIYLGLHSDKDFLVLDLDLLNLKVWFLKKLAYSYRSSWDREAQKHLEFISQI
jgi:hypothetical protein